MKAQKQIKAMAVISTMSLVMTGCLGSDEETLISETFAVGLEDETPAEIEAPTLAPQCFNQRYVQAPAQVTRKIDLLFVTDTSGSLDEEREGIAEGIDAFVAELPEEVDYQIGVMLAHSEDSPYGSRLFQSPEDEPVVLSSSEQTAEEIREDLIDKLTQVPGEWSTDGGEAGLHSLAHAFDVDRLAEAQAEGFFREDAALAVVFIADENDICSEFPEGVTPVPDPNGKEGPAFTAYCASQDEYPAITAELVIEKLQSFVDDRPLLVSGIIYTDEQTVPAGGENEIGYGYTDVIDLATEGLAIDLANGDYEAGLAEIGTLATIVITLVDTFSLQQGIDIAPDTLEVYVDGEQTTEFNYSIEENSVQVTDPGTALSIIDITYCEVPPETGDDDDDDDDDDDIIIGV